MPLSLNYSTRYYLNQCCCHRFSYFIFYNYTQMENYEKSRKNVDICSFETKQQCEPDMFDELFEKALQQNRAEGFVKA